ncbi:MAG: CaiB/BaiF CoA-transferase family protein [Pseudomonadota bacterium]|nr:CaiB/BaiF CoA-transferase family protein [Pseudomonadota bacterium]
MGPLAGMKVVELAGIGPGPFCCMMLADMGAEVIRIDRTAAADLGTPMDPRFNILNRSRKSLALDLKQPEAVEIVLKLVESADVLVEGFRPGVTERLGLGPADCHARNPKLVYGRMTGWGQDGPLAPAAGHDINYIAITGALDSIGVAGGPPVPPLNLVGDFGGGALYLAFGIACAVIEAGKSGKGQVVDAAIVDGAASLMTGMFSALARGAWTHSRGENTLAGGAPWYGVYRTSDNLYISIGSIEIRFWRELLETLGFDPATVPSRDDRANWPVLKKMFAEAFAKKTRAEWTAIMEGTDICFAPVLNLEEAMAHPHMQARGIFVDIDGIPQPGPAPRFDRSGTVTPTPPPAPGRDSREVLSAAGFSAVEIDALMARKVVI